MTEQGGPSEREATVRRLLHRYVVEVVERFGLCPWARSARLADELAVRIAWGAAVDAAHAAQLAREALAAPLASVAMVVLPELAGGRRAIEELRDAVARAIPQAGVAAFAPHAALDLSSPAKLVPYLRCSPDPLLQLVPFSILDAARGAAPVPYDRAAAARALAGHAAPPAQPLADRIADDNHATVAADPTALRFVVEELARSRARSYPLAGISLPAG